MDRVLEPGDARVLQDAAGAPGARKRPALDRVHHDADRRAERGAHGPDPPGFRLGRRFFSEPKLDRAESVCDVPLRRLAELLRGGADPWARAGAAAKAVRGG